MRTSSAAGALLAAALLAAGLPRPASAGPHLSPAAETQLDEGLTRLYSLDYVAARSSFRKLIELEPDNPFGYMFEAGGIWWESSQEFGLFKDTPTLQGLFEEDVDAAQRKADAYIDSKDPQIRADGYFVSGMALGTLGQWRLMRGHWMDAYFAGKKAIKHLKKCVKMDPTYYDAQLGLGVFDYQTAHLSGIAKLGILLGVHGDEKRGLEEIQIAADKSRYASRQASEFLMCIFIIDLHDFARALPVVQKLRENFPQSPYYQFLEALLRHRLGDQDASLALARELYAQIAADPAAFRPKWMTLVCGLSGADCLTKPDALAALPWFDHALGSHRQGKARRIPRAAASFPRPTPRRHRPPRRGPRRIPQDPDLAGHRFHALARRGLPGRSLPPRRGPRSILRILEKGGTPLLRLGNGSVTPSR